MTDDPEIDRLRAALQAAPASDPGARADALNRAMAAYEDSALSRQGSPPPPRPAAGRAPTAGTATGVRKMLKALTLKPFLAATASATALAVGLVVFLPQAEAPPGRVASSDAGLAPQELARNGEPVADPAPSPQTLMTREAAPATPQAEAAAVRATEAAPSVMAAPEPAAMPPAPESRDVFTSADGHPVQVTAEAPVSTFPADVDSASFAAVRSSLMAGALPEPDAVLIEELVNHFPYAYPAPEAGEPPFRPQVTVMQTPWNADTRLVHIGVQGRLPEGSARAPLNLVLLIDTSDAMTEPGKLPLLRQSVDLMLADLRPEDQLAIVTYGGSTGQVLAPTPGSERATILSALDRLEAGGPTAEAAGLPLAYDLAEGMAAAGEVSRILLATDGNFNLGVDDPEGLDAFVARKRKSGVSLSVLGFGRDTPADAVMQSLAQTGNGTAAYADTLTEARKALADQVSGPLFPLADGLQIEVEWNPAQVAEYRLIGHEAGAPPHADAGDDPVGADQVGADRLEDGEIRAGHQVTAIYEVTAPGSPALRHDPLRYGTVVAEAIADEAATGEIVEDAPELGLLRLHYRAPGETVDAVIEVPIVAGTEAGPEARFASAIAGFGQLLRGAAYLNDWGWDQAITLAEANRGDDRFGYRNAAVTLMRQAQALAQ